MINKKSKTKKGFMLLLDIKIPPEKNEKYFAAYFDFGAANY